MKQAGFTLIEIIAVLVILGILAAVAIPKYQDLQETARTKALDGALAAGASQLTMAYSKALLEANGVEANIDVSEVLATCDDITGDYEVKCSGGPGTYTVTATDPNDSKITASKDYEIGGGGGGGGGGNP